MPLKRISVLFLAILCFGISNNISAQNKNASPNIIVFLVDDMGLMDTKVSFITDGNGKPIKQPLNDYYKTPNMEELAENGIRFTQFYAHSVCSPTRVSFLTGQNSARHRVTNWIHSRKNNKGEFGPQDWNWEGPTKQSVTLPKVLQKNGYKTIHIGKAHFGAHKKDGEDPLNLGFDVNIAGGAMGRPSSYYGRTGYGNINGNKTVAVPHLEKYYKDDIFLTEALTIEAKEQISLSKKENKPFFLYMSHYAVHGPFNSDPRFADHYESSNKPVKAKAFATLIEGMDKSLGDIVKHLKSNDLDENTIIIFLGDNGSAAPLPITDNYSSSFPLKGKKGNCWEGGTRVPFITSWVTPNSNNAIQKNFTIPENGIQTQIGTVIDLFPTICEIAQVEMPKNHTIDGYSLQKQLIGKKNASRDEDFLNHFPHDHKSSYFSSYVHNGWKIIYHYQIKDVPEYELYNLKTDPYEKNNLANSNPEKLKYMLAALVNKIDNYDGLYPEKNGQPIRIKIPK